MCPTRVLTYNSCAHSFDHQMFVHSATQRLFVFGGKIQRPVGLGGATDDLEEERYSGMFCYDIALQRWSHLL